MHAQMRLLRRAAVMAAAAALLSSVALAQETPTRGGKATAWLSRDFGGFDHLKVPGASQGRYQILAAAGDFLFEQNAVTGATVPRLALSASHSDDYEIWTVQLRPGVKFSNGEDLTAQAYADHFDRLLASNLKSVFVAELGAKLEKVTAPDPLTIVFAFAEPARAFDAAMATPLYMWFLNAPKFAAENQNKPDYNLMAVGTGPYMVQKYDVGSQVVMVRNPYFWNASEQLLDEITFRIVAAAETAAPYLQTLAGDMDMMWSFGPAIPEAKKVPDRLGVVVGYRNTMLGQLNFNTEKPPFDDIRVRQALAMAIDRKALADVVSQGTAEVADQSYPSGFPFHCTGINYVKYDVAKAKALLKDYGKPIGPIDLWSDGPETMRAAAEVIQEMWTQLGLKVLIKQSGRGTASLVSTVSNGDAPAWITAGGMVMHPTTYDQNLRSDQGDNGWRLKSPRIDAAIDRVNAAATPDELKAAHCAFEQAKADELPYVVYAHMPIAIIHGKRIRGLTPPASAVLGYHRAYVAK